MKRTALIQKDLVEIAIALNILRLSIGMSGVFIPLIILNRGAALWIIAAFYVAYACVKLVLNYPITHYIQRRGAHVGLGVGFFASGVLLACILGFSWIGSYWLLAIGSVALAVSNAFVWNSQHVHISRAMDESTKSSTIATIEIAGQFLDILAPVIGGIIGMVFGSAGLLIVSLSLLFVSIVPLRKMGQLTTKNATVQLRYDLSGAPARDLIANFCFNIETAVGVMLWPIYLAVVLKTFGSIGLVAALAAACTALTVWIAGRRGDAGKDRQVLTQGACMSSVSHVMRIFATTPLSIGLVSVVYKSSLAYLGNAWTSTYYAHAKRYGLQYIMSMEIACDFAYLTLWSCLLVVLLLADVNTFFIVAFLIAAMAAWGCLLIAKQHRRA